MSRPARTLRATGLTRWADEIHGFAVRVTTYAIGAVFHCRVDNVDPAAVIARGSGPDVDAAARNALAKAEARLASTRRER